VSDDQNTPGSEDHEGDFEAACGAPCLLGAACGASASAILLPLEQVVIKLALDAWVGAWVVDGVHSIFVFKDIVEFAAVDIVVA